MDVSEFKVCQGYKVRPRQTKQNKTTNQTTTKVPFNSI